MKAEQLLNRKHELKAELDRQTPRSGELWKQAAVRLEEIQNRYGNLPKDVRIHTDRIFPAAAVYLTVKEALGEQTAFSVVENAVISMCSDTADTLRALLRVPGMRSLFVKLWDPVTKKVFGERNGFENVFYPKKDGEFRMDIIACPYCRYFAELGCPEITRIFCENDDRIYGNLPGIKFYRAGTLGKGAERCDFRVRKL